MRWYVHVSAGIGICALGLYGITVLVQSHIIAETISFHSSVEGDDVIQLPQSHSILFVGDIMLGRYVETLMNQHGRLYPFEHVSNLLASHDDVVANLEGPIQKKHAPTPNFTTRFSFDPFVAALLFDQNVRVVSLANNHTFDFGKEAFEETQNFLRDAGVLYAGHPRGVGDASFVRIENESNPIIFFSFSMVGQKELSEDAFTLIKEIPEEHEFVVVGIHWGEEYEEESHVTQQVAARGLIDAGADLIIGHHPHVVQEIEEYKGKIIFYSLGNFIFDQYFSSQVQEGLAVRMNVSETHISYELIAIESVQSQPRVMNEDGARLFLEKLRAKSSESLRDEIGQGYVGISRGSI